MASERYKAAWKRFKRGPHDFDAPEFREHALDFRALTPRTLAHQRPLAAAALGVREVPLDACFKDTGGGVLDAGARAFVLDARPDLEGLVVLSGALGPAAQRALAQRSAALRESSSIDMIAPRAREPKRRAEHDVSVIPRPASLRALYAVSK